MKAQLGGEGVRCKVSWCPFGWGCPSTPQGIPRRGYDVMEGGSSEGWGGTLDHQNSGEVKITHKEKLKNTEKKN